MDVDVDDDDDPGTSWFAEHKAPEKVLQFLTSRKFPLSPRNTIPSTRRQQSQQQQNQQDEQRQPSILDLGTGNGSMLALLRKKGGFKGPMVGVDYSPQSVQLARELQRLRLHSAYESGMESESEEVASSYGGDSDEGNPDDEEHEELVAADNVGAAQAVRVSEEIRFEEWDILASGNEEALAATTTKTSSPAGVKRIDWFPYETGGFDIVLDKGTFDAVSLSADVIDDDDDDKKEKEEEEKKGPKRIQRRVCERYPRIATKLVRKGGFLVVTSCNWTEEELIRWFTDSKTGEDGLDVYDRIEYPRFRFGGREGQGVCTVCFQRRE